MKTPEERLAARKDPPPPVPAYLPRAGSPLVVDKDVYNSIQAASRELVEEFTLPIRSGRAWEVPAGHICQISTPDGAQVGDLNIWNRHNPRERFWASRTRQLHASHVSTHDRLWSSLPYMRPMATIISDTLSFYGKDVNGGRCHDLLGTRCDPYINTILTGGQYDYQCHSNLVRAVIPWGLDERDVHDVINIFQVTGLDDQGRYFMSPCPAEKGDHLEFLAEQDLLMALSTCPGGDLSMWGCGDEETLKCCRPLHVKVFKLQDPEFLAKKSWAPASVRQYRGLHGIAVHHGEDGQTKANLPL